MISLFRKIRQKLLQQNKVGSYLKYAIGEILLVVIGILIALQVNNWNEERKATLKSYSYLNRLIEDIEVILIDTDNAIRAVDRSLKNSILVKNALESQVLPDSLRGNFEDYLTRYHQFFMTLINHSTYNEMISAGELNLIPNLWIRNAFSDLSTYREFITEINRTNHDSEIMKSNEFQPYIRYSILNPGTDSSKVIPSYDFKSMSANPSLINKVSRQSLTWNGLLRMFKDYKSDVLEIRDSIQVELKKHN